MRCTIGAVAAAAAATAWYMLVRRRSAVAAPIISPTMAAVVARDQRCVIQTDTPTPSPTAGQVLIRLHATAINRLDCIQRAGKAPVPPGVTEVLGLEGAGVVVAVGSGDVGGLSIGDEVLALLPGGGYAQYAAVDASTCMLKPRGLSWAAAGSICEAWLTVSQGVEHGMLGHA